MDTEKGWGVDHRDFAYHLLGWILRSVALGVVLPTFFVVGLYLWIPMLIIAFGFFAATLFVAGFPNGNENPWVAEEGLRSAISFFPEALVRILRIGLRSPWRVATPGDADENEKVGGLLGRLAVAALMFSIATAVWMVVILVALQVAVMSGWMAPVIRIPFL